MTAARVGVLLLSAALTACASAPKTAAPSAPREDKVVSHAPAAGDRHHAAAASRRSPYPPAQEDPSKRGDYVAGGLYAPHISDSAPEGEIDVDAIPEPEVRDEPRARTGNRTYSVLGREYRVRDSAHGYLEEGTASYYGKKFHGRRTSSQEVYDMYAFSAAHRTLPLPSYARVTNLDNGKSVIVRVNDRGPFHSARIIDLSYAAAVKLDMIKRGTARVEVRALTPDDREGAGETARREPRRRDRDDGRTSAATPAATPAEGASPAQGAGDGARSADEFERWMQAQGIRIASGRPASGTVPSTTAPSTTMSATPAVEVATPTALPVAETIPARGESLPPVAPAPAAGPSPAGDASGVLLQFGAYGERANAERARDRLLAGGFDDARLDETEVNGRRIWRVRIGPVAAERVPELSARSTDLGIGPAQIVRD